MILNGNTILAGLTAEIANVNTSLNVFFFLSHSVDVLENYREGLGNLQSKSVPTPFI
jgi:hypothetical protein